MEAGRDSLSATPGLQYETGSFDMRNKKVDENKKSEIADCKKKEVSHV
jgi:hypothetical protein